MTVSTMSYGPVVVETLPNRGQGTLSTTHIPAGSVILTDIPILKVHATHADSNGSVPLRFHNLTAAAIKHAYRELTEEQKNLFNTLDAGEPSKLYPDVLEKRVRRVLVNGFTLGEKGQTWIVCPRISRLNHSCVPNAGWFPIPNKDVYKLMAMKDISEGEEITLCYRDELDGMIMHARRQLLLKDWGFICTCEACGPFKPAVGKATKGPLKALQQGDNTAPFELFNLSNAIPTTTPTSTTKRTTPGKPMRETHDVALSDLRRTLISALGTICDFDKPAQLIQLFQQDPLQSLTSWWFRAELLAAESLTGREQAISWSIAATMLHKLVEGFLISGAGSSQLAQGATITMDGSSKSSTGVPESAENGALRALAWKRKAVDLMSCCVLEDYDDNLLDFREELDGMRGWCEGRGICERLVEEKDQNGTTAAREEMDELLDFLGAGADGVVKDGTMPNASGENADRTTS